MLRPQSGHPPLQHAQDAVKHEETAHFTPLQVGISTASALLSFARCQVLNPFPGRHGLTPATDGEARTPIEQLGKGANMSSARREVSRVSACLAMTVGTLVTGTLLSPPTAAQTAPPAQAAGQAGAPQGPTALNPEQLQEVVVTAQFRAETAQQTPISLTAVTGEQLA